MERKPGSLSSNNGIPTVTFFFDFANKKKRDRDRERERERDREREREKRNAEISAVLNTINDFADIFHVLNS